MPAEKVRPKRENILSCSERFSFSGRLANSPVPRALCSFDSHARPVCCTLRKIFNTMTYTPKPIDVSHVTISADLEKLIERVAENVHELWAEQRIKEGWKWGPRRDDAARQHPGLVPYTDLSESEKEYDRITTRGVLKSVLALGYRIQPPQ